MVQFVIFAGKNECFDIQGSAALKIQRYRVIRNLLKQVLQNYPMILCESGLFISFPHASTSDRLGCKFLKGISYLFFCLKNLNLDI